jgi:uncharacterized membrane protein
MYNFLATDSVVVGGASLYGLFLILSIIYGIICFFVPICIYLMSGRVKEIRNILLRLERQNKS